MEKPLLSTKHILDSTTQKYSNEINNAINNGTLHLKYNPCLCGSNGNDILISSFDMYNINMEIVLCKNCGLIRNKYVLDEKSSDLFYQQYYRKLYNSNTQIDSYFEKQITRGLGFVKLLKELKIYDKINNIAEFGCGAGGVLYPFHNEQKNVIGVDFDKNYLNFGRKHNINTVYGDFFSIIEDNSIDLIIMSHILEHLNSPIDDLAKVIKKIKPEGFLLVEVPGLYWKSPDNWFNPILYFQNAHVYQYFYKDYLWTLFELLNLKVLYGDERCTFVCQKNHCSSTINNNIRNLLLKTNYKKIILYLKYNQRKYRFNVIKDNIYFFLKKSCQIIKKSLNKIANK